MDPHLHHHCHLIHPTTVTAAATTVSSCCHSCYTPPPYFYPPNLSPPPPPHYPQSHHQHLNPPKYPPHHHPDTPPTPDQATIVSLHRRISALEASLRQYFPTVRSSLRDAAARTIQTHYRAFLVRRSRTVRQLKTLAVVKSSLNLLKLMVSDNTHIDTRAISRKAMSLILKIDSIQGGDSMIRDGKRSISRDLDRFLGLVNGLSAKRNKLYSFGLKNTKARILYNGQHVDTSEFVGDERGLKERTRARVQSSSEYYYVSDDNDDDEAELENFRILSNGKTASLPKRKGGLAKRHVGGGNKGKAKKSVTFAENSDHRSRGFVNAHGPNSSEEEGSVDEEGELMDNLCRRVEKLAAIAKKNGDNNQEAYSEEEESSQNNNGEKKLKKGSSRADEANYQSDEDFVFPVSKPTATESRADVAKTRKPLKIGE